MFDVLDAERLAAVAEVDLVAGRPRRCDCSDFVERKLPLREDVQDLAPDIAGRSNDRDPVTHRLLRIAGGGRLSQLAVRGDMASTNAREKAFAFGEEHAPIDP